jgi:hypothetical protein
MGAPLRLLMCIEVTLKITQNTNSILSI